MRFLNTSMDDKTTKLVYDAFKLPIEHVFLTLSARTMCSHATLNEIHSKCPDI